MKKRIFTITTGIVFIISISIAIVLTDNNKTITTSTSVLSNTKIGWGVKRAPNNEQPDLGKTNIELMEEYHGIAMGNKEKKYVYLTLMEDMKQDIQRKY